MNLKTTFNISIVPHLSPFRYPGGKTWLVPIVRSWLNSQQGRPKEFFEPFAGGGIVSLTVACENLADHVTMSEIDDEIASVWLSILGREGKQFADRVIRFKFTSEAVDRILNQNSGRRIDKAFRTLLKNRINHGGVIALGAGRLKHGDGKGIGSRWYPRTLEQRILNIHSIRDRISFVAGDGFMLLRQFLRCRNSLFFLDPPYTAGGKAAGRRLYNHNDIDHQKLFEMANQLEGDFLMTYEDSDEARHLAQLYGFDLEKVVMKNKLHKKMAELLIARDLSWVR